MKWAAANPYRRSDIEGAKRDTQTVCQTEFPGSLFSAGILSTAWTSSKDFWVTGDCCGP